MFFLDLSVLQSVVVCCSLPKSVAVCRSVFIMSLRDHFISVLQCAAVCCSGLQCVAMCYSVLQCLCHVSGWLLYQGVAVCCNVLQCVAVCGSLSQCLYYVSMWSLYQSVEACCSVSQCAAICCSELQMCCKCVAVHRSEYQRFGRPAAAYAPTVCFPQNVTFWNPHICLIHIYTFLRCLNKVFFLMERICPRGHETAGRKNVRKLTFSNDL